MGILRRIARRCETHDKASPLKIARLEEQTGINPNAVAQLNTGSFTDDHTNPDLIDCGHTWCRSRT
jgi:hypothetical protein